MTEPKDLIGELLHLASEPFVQLSSWPRRKFVKRNLIEQDTLTKAATCIQSLATENAALREKLAEREWQPIESAPRDGIDVHVISTKWLVPVPAYFVSREFLEREYGDPEYMEDGWYPSCKFLFDLPEVTLKPTHWMPLPEPPTLTGGDNAQG